MPDLSPGFEHVLPGAPVAGHQSLTTTVFRWKRYIFYISGQQLNILKDATDLVQTIQLDEELVAVQAEHADGGRIALASKSQVWVLKPASTLSTQVNWTYELCLKAGDDSSRVRTLSWGTEGELLVGREARLALYGTLPASRNASPASDVGELVQDTRDAQWGKPLASPVRHATFSPSAHLIATTGDYDRLVKVWRRLSYEDAIFDFAYLPHYKPVTHVEWRPIDEDKLEALPADNLSANHPADDTCEALYTLCADGSISIWRTNGHNDLEILSLYTIIDLVSAIPHSPVLTTAGASHRPARYAFVLPSSAYERAVAVALKKHPKQQLNHAIEHLKEVSSKNPDIVVVLDAQGRMSAWGLSSVGHKRRPESGDVYSSPFHIAHSEHLGLSFEQGLPASFTTWFDGDVLNILSHGYGKNIKWWRGTVENFSSSAALDFDRGEQVAVWQGSSTLIDVLRSATSGDGFIACSRDGRAQVYTLGDQSHVQVTGSAKSDATAVDVLLTPGSEGMLVLTSGELSLYDTASNKNCSIKQLSSFERASRLVKLEGEDDEYLIFDNTGQYQTCSVDQDQRSIKPSIRMEDKTHKLCLGPSDDSIIAMDIVLHPRRSGWLRVVGINTSGLVYRRDLSERWFTDQSLPSQEDELRFATGLPGGKLAITASHAGVLSDSGTDLAIVDLKDGYIEHKRTLSLPAQAIVFPRHTLDHLSEHSCLAISHIDSIEILLRGRYGHGNDHHWDTVMSVSIAGTGLSICAMTWMSSLRLAFAAGNAVFVTRKKINTATLSEQRRQALELTTEKPVSLEAFASLMHGPVTCWQPHVLHALMLHGHFDAVASLLLQLQSKLRFYTNGDELDSLLGFDLSHLLNKSQTIDDLDLSELGDQLEDLDLPFTSDADQERLKLIAQTVSYIIRYRQSLDANAVRYLAHWRYHVLLEQRAWYQKHSTANGHPTASALDSSEHKVLPEMSWREINFAYHSTTQQPLLNILTQYYENKLDWQTVRALGITLWLHNIKAAQSEGAHMASVEQVFDALGQHAFRASDPPNPADASLFLLALRKKTVLLSLWRMAVGNREQKSTQSFLQRDFTLQEHKTAARKNAYALMGKRRFQYAAAFFLLADDPLSAISILAGQLDDLPLAMSVARAYCGEGSPVIQDFIQERVISHALKSYDRWMLSWGHALMGDHGKMLTALLVGVVDLVGHESEPMPRAWQQDDPVTLAVYQELRVNAKGQALSQITTQDEYRAVLRAARILRRSGLWLLALHLVQSWTFVQSSTSTIDESQRTSNGKPRSAPVAADTPSMLDGYDMGAAEVPVLSEAEARAAKAAALLAKMREKKNAKPSETSLTDGPRAPTQFTEPAASSILDSFGF